MTEHAFQFLDIIYASRSGGTGKGVILKNMDVIDYYHYTIYIFLYKCFIIDTDTHLNII